MIMQCVNKGIDEHSNQLRKLQEQNDELTHVVSGLEPLSA